MVEIKDLLASISTQLKLSAVRLISQMSHNNLVSLITTILQSINKISLEDDQ